MSLQRQRRILLTGATSGIGLELAKRWAHRHCLIVTGRSLSSDLGKLCQQHENCHFIAIDQSNPQNCAIALHLALDQIGWDGLDHAVLNAGTGFVCDPSDEPVDQMVSTINTNLTSSILLAGILYPLLENRHGILTLIGSSARKGSPEFASYAASKAGLHGFARALSSEWRSRVDVQIIHPGPTQTNMHEKAGLSIGLLRKLFVPAPAMAQMIDGAIRTRTRQKTISFLQYWSGESLLARGLE